MATEEKMEEKKGGRRVKGSGGRLWEEVSEEEYEKARQKLITGRAAGEDEIEEVFVKE